MTVQDEVGCNTHSSSRLLQPDLLFLRFFHCCCFQKCFLTFDFFLPRKMSSPEPHIVVIKGHTIKWPPSSILFSNQVLHPSSTVRLCLYLYTRTRIESIGKLECTNNTALLFFLNDIKISSGNRKVSTTFMYKIPTRLTSRETQCDAHSLLIQVLF